MLTAHGNEGFTLFAVPISLAEAALPGQDVVNKQFIKAGAVRRAVEAAIKTRSSEIRKQFLRDFDQRYCEIDITAGPHNFVKGLCILFRPYQHFVGQGFLAKTFCRNIVLAEQNA